jgi:hypothetical protein
MDCDSAVEPTTSVNMTVTVPTAALAIAVTSPPESIDTRRSERVPVSSTPITSFVRHGYGEVNLNELPGICLKDEHHGYPEHEHLSRDERSLLLHSSPTDYAVFECLNAQQSSLLDVPTHLPVNPERDDFVETLIPLVSVATDLSHEFR